MSFLKHQQKSERELLDDEREALGHANDVAGEYIAALGKFDLNMWTADEFQLLITKAMLAYTDRLRELRTYDDVPF